MTLYEFNLLTRDQQLKQLWDLGTYIDNFVSDSERCNLYAIGRFFVEVSYNPKTNKIDTIKSFKTGYLLDKYSSLK